LRRRILNNETVIGLSKADKAILIIIPPILGAFLGWFLPIIAGWLIKVPFIPFLSLLEWIATLEGFWISMIGMGIGIIAGIIFTFFAFHETLKVTISDSEVKLEVKDKAETIQKEDVVAVFMEEKQLILFGVDGIELYRGQPEAKKESVADGFRYHDYPWVEEDPYENKYQRWVANHPDMPSHINTLLEAREHALQKDEEEEAQILRDDLAKLGVVIRDEDKHQYIRTVKGDDK